MGLKERILGLEEEDTCDHNFEEDDDREKRNLFAASTISDGYAFGYTYYNTPMTCTDCGYEIMDSEKEFTKMAIEDVSDVPDNVETRYE